MRCKDYRNKNNDRIRIEMRRIVKERTKVHLHNDSLIDLVVDFLIHPYITDNINVPSLNLFQSVV